MLVIISPAKTLDFNSQVITTLSTEPAYVNEANSLAALLKKYTQPELSRLFNVNARLAELNYNRYQVWQKTPSDAITKQAVLAYKGDVYEGLRAWEWTDEDFFYAQKHLRILTGLYGVLKPMDRIQPYRLEMGTELANSKGENLYDFWGLKITKAIQKSLDESESKVLINLASKEYSKSLHLKHLKAEIITPHFKDFKNGEYKFMSFYGKKARGLMSAYIIRKKISNPEHLKLFDCEGYYYNDSLSKGNTWVFTRDGL